MVALSSFRLAYNVSRIGDGGERLPLYFQREVKFTDSLKVKKNWESPAIFNPLLSDARFSRDVIGRCGRLVGKHVVTTSYATLLCSTKCGTKS